MNSEKYKALIKLSVKNIFTRKVRSILTILSVLIGIAAIVTIILTSNGLFNGIEKEFTDMGMNNLFIMPKSTSFQPNNSVTRSSSNIQLTLTDVKHIKKVHGISDAFGMEFKNSIVKYKNQSYYLAVMLPPEKDFDKILKNINLTVREGQSLQNRKGNYIMIGSYVADNLFKTKVKIGNNLTIENQKFKVIGIMNEIGNSKDDSTIYMTRETGTKLYNIGNEVMAIRGIVDPSANITDTKARVIKELEKTHPVDSYNVISANQILGLIEKILLILKIILLSIAAISVVVGSVGVMNSIYTSVIERTKEIGIFKSIGAKKNDILFIFVTESLMLSLIGGVLGLVIGIFGAKLIEAYTISLNFTMLHIIVNYQIIVITIILALIVGLISGIFPAKKASKKNVVDCLRAI